MPSSHAPGTPAPRPPFVRAAALFLALALPLLCAACNEEKPATTTVVAATAAPSATAAASATAASSSAPEPSSFMRIGTVTPAVGAAAATGAPATGGAERGPEAAPSAAAKTKGKDDAFGADAPPPPVALGAPAGGVPAGRGGKSVAAATVEAVNALSGEEVRAAILQRQSDFKACYDLGRSGSSELAGSVNLHVRIQASGTVAGVDVTGSSTHSTVVDSCVKDAVSRIKFPAKDGETVVAFPIDFGG